MKLSKEQVLKIAGLARLKLTEEEVSRLSNELTDILTYVEMLNEVDTEKVEATSQVTGLSNVLREDSVRAAPCEPEELLACSPLPKDGNQIRVKRVL
ncbi:MAG: Asp-tRNA(Asn)/Glu-tRNA(Gln) amidotransferase subunit GatC [Candidatus Gracilibacteria bacterium]|jgi:aspartyl-tRNA(Asn)/glutamyl-tRNA(Gln) amidotransferase subunit C